MGKKRRDHTRRPPAVPRSGGGSTTGTDQHSATTSGNGSEPKLADIVIPVYGALDKLELCLAALVQQNVTEQANVYIVDDAGPQPAAPVAAKYGFRCHRLETNRGFGEACNYGAKLGKAPYIIFMNSDVYVQEGCIPALITEFGDPKVGIVGAKLLFPPDAPAPAAGRVQHAGIVFDPYRNTHHRFFCWRADHPRVNIRERVQAVTGALMAVRRKTWNKCQGFDPLYGRGTFEDVDLCIVAGVHGYMTIYTPFAVALHCANGSGQPFPLHQNQAAFLHKCAAAVVWDEWMLL